MTHNFPYLQDLLTNILTTELGTPLQIGSFELNVPEHDQFGDYTTNLALKIWKKDTKKQYQSAGECAKDVVDYLLKYDTEKRIAKAEIARPGFINIWISHAYLNMITTETESFLSEDERKRAILIEFMQPNTNKQLHIGHVLNGVLGNAVVNTMRAAGYTVDAGTINNDRGIHIIKSMYGYLRCARKENVSVTVEGLITSSSDEKQFSTLLQQWIEHPDQWITPSDIGMKPDHLIGWCYTKGNTIGETDEQSQGEMQQMLISWESGDSDVRALWSQLNSWFYEGYHQTLHTLMIVGGKDGHSFFDRSWYESEIYKNGKDIILNNIDNGIITEYEDGHVEAELEKTYNIPNIVLLRKDKTALYITQDIELLRSRLKDNKYDQVVYVVDYRQSLQFRQLFLIVASLGVSEAMICKHLAYGEVRTPQGSMSSRKGNIISADWLIEETTNRAYKEISNEKRNYTEEEKKYIAHHVALAAIKYGMLKYNPTSNIVFDIDTNVAFEGDTGPYLQYTYARTCNILVKAKDIDIPESIETEYDVVNVDLEMSILRLTEKYPFIIYQAAKNQSPNLMCEYLYDLAQKYNTLYAEKRILNEEDAVKKEFRLVITNIVKHTISKGLKNLGIVPLEKM